MRDNFLKRIVKAKIIFPFSLLILILISIAFLKEFLKAQKINQEIMAMENEIANLKSQNSEFSELIKYLNSNAFMEERARLDLGLKKPEESILIIPDNINLKKKTVKESSTIERVSNFYKWLDYIFAPY